MKEVLNNIVILIPALNPGNNIIEVIKDLKKEGFSNIIVINDGSDDNNRKYFNILNDEFNVKVYNHEKNLGKGQALKTGIKKIINEEILGVITVDADGQHLAKDVTKIAAQMNKDKIIFGARKLVNNKVVPMASKIGNIFSSMYLKLLTGVYLEDTQTGLRGIPKKYFKVALEIPGNRYDYEMNFLKNICQNKIDFDIVPIETIYENRIKNFRIIKDSIIVYKEFFKNLISSLLCSIVDIAIFGILVSSINSIFFSNIFARIFSGGLDFLINKLWVYRKNNSKNMKEEVRKYLVLFIVQMMLNTLLVASLSMIFYEFVVIIKIIVNVILYLTNFFIKGRYIFK